MPATRLLQLLARSEVTELVLSAGSPLMARTAEGYRRVDADSLHDEDIIVVLAALGGREHLAGLADGRTWTFVAPELGTIQVQAAYRDTLLRVTLRLLARARAGVGAPANDAATRAYANAEQAKRKPLPARISPQAAEPPPARSQPNARWMPKPAGPPPRVVETTEAPAPPRPAARPARAEPPPAADVDGFELASTPPPHPSAANREWMPAPETQAGGEPSQPSASGAGDKAVVDDLHHAFHFEPDNAWAPSHPPPGTAASGGTGKLKAKRFVGDRLDDLLGLSRELHASDVHVLANRPPTLRIAGELVPQGDAIAEAEAEQLLMTRVPEALHEPLRRDGSCDFSLVHPAYGRFRANVSRQRTGIKLTARPIGETIPTLAELGLPDSIKAALHHHQGLIVIAGPTGHGKTTTLAAIVGIINRETSHHVITVEDPIEYVHPPARAVISQREVGKHTKSFQAALKGSLREDPDVIVVGELRDTETVRMALTASETGHLVISTMNTPSAAKAIERLIDLFPPGDQPQVRMSLAGGLRLILAQRLVPSADGKELCAAAEILPGNLPLWNLIRENRTYQIASLQQRGKSLGIVRLDDSLVQLVKAGKITLERAREVADAPEQVEAMVMGRPIVQRPSDDVAAKSAAKSKPAAQPGAGAATTQGASSSVPAQQAAKGLALGKQMLSRAGKLFGGESDSSE